MKTAAIAFGLFSTVYVEPCSVEPPRPIVEDPTWSTPLVLDGGSPVDTSAPETSPLVLTDSAAESSVGVDSGSGSCTTCPAGYVCAIDPNGGYACKKSCALSSDCASVAGTDPCCAIGGTGYIACVPPSWATYGECACAQGSDCTAIPGKPACAPSFHNGAVFANVLVCKPNDAQPWDGCNPTGDAGAPGCCPNGYECWGDQQGNNFCTIPCTGNNICRNGGLADVGCCMTSAQGGTCNSCGGATCGTGGCTHC